MTCDPYPDAKAKCDEWRKLRDAEPDPVRKAAFAAALRIHENYLKTLPVPVADDILELV